MESAEACYLGNPSVPQTHLPSLQDKANFYFAQGMYLNWLITKTKIPFSKYPIDYLDNLTSALAVEHVTSGHWGSFIYKSVPINANSRAGRTAPDICASVDPLEMIACDMVYMTDTHCHYGDFSITNGTLIPNGGSWDLFIKQGKDRNF